MQEKSQWGAVVPGPIPYNSSVAVEKVKKLS